MAIYESVITALETAGIGPSAFPCHRPDWTFRAYGAKGGYDEEGRFARPLGGPA